MPNPLSPAPIAALAELAGVTNGAPSADSAHSGETITFAALYQQTLGKQADTATWAKDTKLMILQEKPADPATADMATGELSALMPFLEAMGLVSTTDKADESESGVTATPDGSQITALPITPAVTVLNLNIAANSAAAAGTSGNTALAQMVPTDSPGRNPALAEQVLLSAVPSEPGSPVDTEFAATLARNSAAVEAPLLPANASPVAQVATHLHTASTTAASPPHPLPHAVGSHDWNNALGNHVAWMAGRQENRAELVLTPPQMGRVEVSLTITGDQASANFFSANPIVREALEAALPRLREVLAQTGIQLEQAQVGAESFRQAAEQQKSGDNPARQEGRPFSPDQTVIAAGGVTDVRGLKQGRGLVDVFA